MAVGDQLVGAPADRQTEGGLAGLGGNASPMSANPPGFRLSIHDQPEQSHFLHKVEVIAMGFKIRPRGRQRLRCPPRVVGLTIVRRP
jgi:hypothetical protein